MGTPVAAAAMAFDQHTLLVALPTLTMTVSTAAFYGLFYMNDPSMKYISLGKKWIVDGSVQLSPEHFQFTDQQPPLVTQ